MARSTTLAIKIVSDGRQAAAGFDQAERKVGGFTRGLDRAAGAAGVVVAGMGALAYQAFQSASDLQQSSGAIEKVFGDQAAAVDALARKAAQANGLSRNSYQELASVIGSQLGNMGIAHEDLVPKTQQLIDLGSDLAATYGGEASDAVSALSSLLRGETDPIERYGVSIKQSDINARLAAQGNDKLEGSAAKLAQTQAVLSLLSEQTGSSLGAFAAESDTAAGSLQIARAEMDNASAALGEALLPLVADGAGKLAELAGWVQANSDVVIPLGVAFTAAAAAIWLTNIALAANPMVWIVLAIAAVVAGVVIMYQKFEWFRDFVSILGQGLKLYFTPFVEIIKWVVDKIMWLKDNAGAIVDFINPFGGAAPAVAPAGGGAPAYGAARGAVRMAAPMRSAPLIGLGGGSSPAAAQAPGSGNTYVQVDIHGAIDPVSVGRQVVGILREYGVATGGQVTVTMGGRS